MNFLPLENQESFRKKYFKKLAIVFCVFLLFIEIAVLFLLAPSYLFLKSKRENYERESAILNQSPVFKNFEKIKSEISGLKKKINSFSENSGTRNVENFFEEMVKTKPKDLKINVLLYERNSRNNTSDILSVSGEAVSRKSFLDFIENLKKNKEVADIDSPASNLLKDSNLDFSFNIYFSK